VNDLSKLRSSSGLENSRHLWRACSVIATLLGTLISAGAAQAPQRPKEVTIQGNVLNSVGKPVGDASVRLKQNGAFKPVETKTNAKGVFAFTALPIGLYLLRAEKSGLSSHETVLVLEGKRSNIDLTLDIPGDIQSNSSVSSPSSTQAMEFSDKPNFTIAGVTDWTAVGGHGSDSTLRTSEDLARETLTLKPERPRRSISDTSSGAGEKNESESQLHDAVASAPESFEANHRLGEFYLHARRYQDSIPLLQTAYRIDSARDDNAYDLALAYKETGEILQAHEYVRKLIAHKDTADLHRLAGELDEKLGDPLAAVKEEEQAVRLDPSEQNYFEWGSELLLHRAVWQAADVFKNGAKAYPKSARMLTALGTALFAGALYDEAALRLCNASDLNPTDPEPYIFMGKVEMATPTTLPCVEQKLARFVQDQPNNAVANYLYAISLWKRQEQPADQRALQQVETLLTKAVTIDPKCVGAYLQLGIFYSAQRDYEKAISFYTKAIEVDPQLSEAHYRLGVAYDRTGELAKAKNEFLLHGEIEKQQSAAVERQRREIKQFIVVLQGQPASPVKH
jgi:tetratricopeptide (TPR) repeat protein